MCLPGAARSEHGVEHASDGLPSSVAVAPPGLLKMLTSGGTAGRTGAAARSALGVGVDGSRAADFTASLGGVVAGSAGAGFAASFTAGLTGAGAGVARGRGRPPRPRVATPPRAAPPAAPGVTPGAAAGTDPGGTAATGDSAFGAAAACPPLSDGCEPGKCHEPSCEPTNASNPAAARTANRNVRNPGFRPTSAVAAPGSPQPLRRGRVSTAGATISGACTSAIVAAFSRPPRGIDFHPLVAPQAFSSDSMNSWPLR